MSCSVWWQSGVEKTSHQTACERICNNSNEEFALLILENIWKEWVNIDAKELFFENRNLS